MTPTSSSSSSSSSTTSVSVSTVYLQELLAANKDLAYQRNQTDWLSNVVGELSRILLLPPSCTMKDLPAHATTLMAELNKLRVAKQ